MKPSITVDERGVILHVTTDAGDGVAVPLNAELVQQAAEGLARLTSPEGKRKLLQGFGRLVLELASPEKKKHG